MTLILGYRLTVILVRIIHLVINYVCNIIKKKLCLQHKSIYFFFQKINLYIFWSSKVCGSIKKINHAFLCANSIKNYNVNSGDWHTNILLKEKQFCINLYYKK